MSENKLSFDHIHIISEDPRASATWYSDIAYKNTILSQDGICIMFR